MIQNNFTKTKLTVPYIGIVTVLYNSDDVLPGFFDSLAQQQQVQFRLYIIDNSPTDSGTRLSKDLATKYGIDAVCQYNDHNGGVAAGNNQGIRLALADGCTHILLANNDTEFPLGTIAGLLSTLQIECAQAVTPKIYYYGSQKLLWYAGAPFYGWTARSPHRGMGKKDIGQFNLIEDTEYAPTCFMLIDKSVFDQVGFMDEQYFCYCDDTDFVYRMRRNGGRLVYDPSQIVEHKVSSSTGGDESPFSLFYMNRNRVYFARKNLPGMQKLVALLYMTITRIIVVSRMDRTKAERILSGMREGWKMRVTKS